MLKTSSYNLYFAVAGEKVIYNGLTGSFASCTPGVWEAMRTNQLDGLRPDTAALLANLGFITTVSQEQDLRHFLAMAGVYLEPHGLQVYFMPSYNCNFRCPYCFEKWRLSKGKAWLTQVMSIRQVQDYYRVLAAQPQGQKITTVGLYGGEPFLPEHRAVVTAILAGAADQGIRNTHAFSNGYKLDLFLPLLVQYQFQRVTVTLDGSPSNHNKRRFLFNGQGTYAKIATNISLLLDNGIGVELRTNLDSSNVNDLPELEAEAAKRGWTAHRNFRLNVSRAKNTSFSNDIPCARTQAILLNLQQALTQKSFLKPVFNYCLATGHTWIIDPFGTIYPCLEFVGHPELAIGQISAQGVELNSNYLPLKNRRALKLEGCKDCAYQLFCAGGCASLAQERLGDFRQGYCDLIRQQVNRAMRQALAEYLTPLPPHTDIQPLNRGLGELYRSFTSEQLQLLARQHTTLRMRLYLKLLQQ